MTGMKRALGCVCALVVFATSPCRGDDFNAEKVREILASASPDKPADVSGKSLENLDLSNLDFKLAGTDLTGVDATEADLGGAVLKDVRGLKRVIAFRDLSSIAAPRLSRESGNPGLQGSNGCPCSS